MQTIVCHGDSLTQGADLEDAYRWPSLLSHALTVRVINSGIGGDTTGGCLARFYPDVMAHKPRIVLLMGGTNDLWWNLEISVIVANLFAMVSQARYHLATPLLGLPLPIDVKAVRQQDFAAPLGGYTRFCQKLADLNDALRQAAIESEIGVLDFYQLFFNADGKLRSELFLEDGLHPNGKGHHHMATYAVQIIRQRFLFV